MDFRTAMTRAAAKFYTRHGKPAVWTPAAGSAVDCHVFINFDVVLQPGTDAQVWERGTTIEGLLSETITAPSRGDSFTVEETTYTVQELIENDGIKFTVQVT